MYIPYDGETIHYLIYSKSIYVEVLYDNNLFYMNISNMSILLDVSKKKIENSIRKLYKKKKYKDSISDDDEIIGTDMCYGLSVFWEIGNPINMEETNMFIKWAYEMLDKYKIQKDGSLQFIHSTEVDYYFNLEPYFCIEDGEGISLELMICYLKLVGSFYIRFIDKLEEIEKSDKLTIQDIEYLDAVKLCYIKRRLKDSEMLELGDDILKNVYLATIKDVVTRIKEYLTGNVNTDSSNKINSLRVKILKWNKEPKQMLYLVERFDYFANILITDYAQVTIEEEQEFANPYAFNIINREASKIIDPVERRAFFVDAKIKANKELIEMEDGDRNKDDCQKLIDKCTQFIDLTDYEISQKQVFYHSLITSKETEVVNQTKSFIKPAPKKKTDIIKILSAMYDARLFAGEDGKPLTNKQKLMEAFGEFLGDDFSTYSASLSQAKTRDEKTFIKPFKEIEKEALKYFDAVAE